MIDEVEFSLTGLRANKLPLESYKIGDVVHRKYGKEWHIYVPVVNSFDKHVIRRAINDHSYVPEHLEHHLKARCRPLTKINDKVDNPRPMLGDIIIKVDTKSGRIIGHRFHYATAKAPVTEEDKTAREAHYAEMPSYGVFLVQNKHN
jgi:hypothetical protein